MTKRLEIKNLEKKSLIKETNPLVLCLTNSVVKTITANALLAFGASPIMSEDPDDTLQLSKLANSVLINIGTLNKNFVGAVNMLLESCDKPIILDPVGCGATEVRTVVAKKILQSSKVTLVRGNLAEVLSLLGAPSKPPKGVDSTLSLEPWIEWLIQRTQSEKSDFYITGESNIYISKGEYELLSPGGFDYTKRTGMGCVQGALLAAFMGSGHSTYEAVIAVNELYNVNYKMYEKNSKSYLDLENLLLKTLANI